MLLCLKLLQFHLFLTSFRGEKQLSICPKHRLRHTALSSHEQVEARKLRKYLLYCLVLRKKHSKIKLLSKILSIKYLSTIFQSTDDLEPIERPLRWLVTVDSFSASRFYMYFKFKKADLYHTQFQ